MLREPTQVPAYKRRRLERAVALKEAHERQLLVAFSQRVKVMTTQALLSLTRRGLFDGR